MPLPDRSKVPVVMLFVSTLTLPSNFGSTPRSHGASTSALPADGCVSSSTLPSTNGATPLTNLFEATGPMTSSKLCIVA